MKEYKNVYREINLGGGRFETALIGKVEVPTKEKEQLVEEIIYGGCHLGYGYKNNGLYHFNGVVEASLAFCKEYAKKRDLPKWDKENILGLQQGEKTAL